MKKAGAPCKLTPEVNEIIIKAVRNGLPWCHAYALAGVNERTALGWKNQGEKDETEGKDTIFSHFIRSLKKAHGEWVQERLAGIKKAADSGNWTADAWQLERRDQDNFSLKTKHEITGEKGGPVEIKITFDE